MSLQQSFPSLKEKRKGDNHQGFHLLQVHILVHKHVYVIKVFIENTCKLDESIGQIIKSKKIEQVPQC